MTAKQKAARARFKAVQAEAKKLRAKNKKLSQAQAVKQAWAVMYSKGKVGATLLIEKGESKRTKPKRVIQLTRTKQGQFKKVKAVGAMPGKHKDTRSHNVNIRVVSGVDNIELTRITNDLNGNPRYVVHFLNFLNDEEKTYLNFTQWYEAALKKARKIGGKKYHNKSYGGGIVFQSYNTDELKQLIAEARNK